MRNDNKLQRRIPEIVIVVMLRIFQFRRWIAEMCIVAMMIILLLIEIGIRLAPGRHTVTTLIVVGLLFGLTALWVHVNRAALAAWETESTEEQCTNYQTGLRDD